MHGLELSQCVLLSGFIPVVYLKYTTDVFQEKGLLIIMVLSGNYYCLSSTGACNLLRTDFYLEQLSSVWSLKSHARIRGDMDMALFW